MEGDGRGGEKLATRDSCAISHSYQPLHRVFQVPSAYYNMVEKKKVAPLVHYAYATHE